MHNTDLVDGHERGCPAIADDEGDYEFLADAGECVCVASLTDSELLDWLSIQVEAGCAHADRIDDSSPTLADARDSKSVAYRAGLRVSLFTIGSQHVNGRTFRDAIRIAIATAR